MSFSVPLRSCRQMAIAPKSRLAQPSPHPAPHPQMSLQPATLCSRDLGQEHRAAGDLGAPQVTLPSSVTEVGLPAMVAPRLGHGPSCSGLPGQKRARGLPPRPWLLPTPSSRRGHSHRVLAESQQPSQADASPRPTWRQAQKVCVWSGSHTTYPTQLPPGPASRCPQPAPRPAQLPSTSVYA